jgi:hypothetical protein
LEGHSADLDEILSVVRKAVDQLGIRVVQRGGSKTEIVGWPESPAEGGRLLQWIVPGFPEPHILADALLITPSVQDVLNLRSSGHTQSAIVMTVPLSGLGDPGEPLLIEPSDVGASIRIWRALSAGRPVIYPEDSAFYEQVFHAGLSYSKQSEAENPIRMATDASAEFRSLAHLPTQADALKFLKILLRA